MSKKVPHQAFAIEYNGVVPQLETKVGIVSAFDKTTRTNEKNKKYFNRPF